MSSGITPKELRGLLVFIATLIVVALVMIIPQCRRGPDDTTVATQGVSDTMLITPAHIEEPDTQTTPSVKPLKKSKTPKPKRTATPPEYRNPLQE
ncbi:MAG: hypothetical protein NC339_05565 [Muribaculaceae bacterium]|nr:hypothetical protein [Muribaculaceae bacterium]